jgi:hypothetical protein
LLSTILIRSVIPATQEEEIRRVWVIPGQLEQRAREMPSQSINELGIMVHACVIPGRQEA